MEVLLIAFITSLATATVTGIISFIIQERRLISQTEIVRLRIEASFKEKIEEIKTEYMAEMTAKKYLSHPDVTRRSFSLLKARLGGFSEDELRKILVRAGAVKFMGHNKKEKTIEWWGLLERNPDIFIKEED